MIARSFSTGADDFRILRQNNGHYVDKTDLVFKLVTEGGVYFLARPRCFGMSLLHSTLQAYFEGAKDLFRGLAIESLETKWDQYPVLRLDLNFKGSSHDLDSVCRGIEEQLGKCAQFHGVALRGERPCYRFANLVADVKKRKGKNVVVLVDGYDAALLSSFGDSCQYEAIKEILGGFFVAVQWIGADLKFLLVSGVTKLRQMNDFWGLHDVLDLSGHYKYGSLCGFTEMELRESFREELTDLAIRHDLAHDECVARIHAMYGGYRFGSDVSVVHNPSSILELIRTREFKFFRFQDASEFGKNSRVMTHLLGCVNAGNVSFGTLGHYQMGSFDLLNFQHHEASTAPLMCQIGALTIKDYEKRYGLYTLGFPNAEVIAGVFGDDVHDMSSL